MNTNHSIVIRSAFPQDAAALLEIYAPYVLETAITFEYEVPSVEAFADRIRQTIKRYPYFVAEENGYILGYAYAGAFRARTAYNWTVETSIYVNRARKRDGIGGMLYTKLEEELSHRGFINMYACISYPPQEDPYLSTNSAEFHQHMGYRLVGRLHQCGYKFHRWYDIIYMEKIIGEHHAKHTCPFRITEV